ncbi:hypothetical protein T08_9223 [Trichinella sp. T8]|nr:hypothetical protein T08_9223 [Trichinella sp. T8]
MDTMTMETLLLSSTLLLLPFNKHGGAKLAGWLVNDLPSHILSFFFSAFSASSGFMKKKKKKNNETTVQPENAETTFKVDGRRFNMSTKTLKLYRDTTYRIGVTSSPPMEFDSSITD